MKYVEVYDKFLDGMTLEDIEKQGKKADGNKKYIKLYQSIIMNGFCPKESKPLFLVVGPNFTFAELLQSNGCKNYKFTGAGSRLESSIRDANGISNFYCPHGEALKKMYSAILVFASRDDEEKVKSHINKWYPRLVEGGALHLYVPKKLIEKRENNPAWTAIQNCPSVIVNFFDRAEFAPGSPECCHVVIQKDGRQETCHDILFRKLVQTKEGLWQPSETALVPMQDLTQHPYRQLDRMISKEGYRSKINEEAIEYPITRELSVWVSVAKHRNSYRATYRVYNPETNDQGKLHGANVIPGSRISRSGFTSTYEAMCSAEDFLINQERGKELADRCRNMIREAYWGKPLSLKTLWFLYYPDIMKQKKYKSIPLASLFLKADSLDDPVCAFPVSQEMDLALWDELFKSLCEELEGRGENINHIMMDFYYLFERAVLNFHCEINPLHDWFTGVKKTSKAKYNTRKRLGRHSIFPEEEKYLLDILSNDLANIDLAEALYFKYYTGLSWRELLALTWKNILVIEDVTDPKAKEKTFHKCMPMKNKPDLVKVRVQKYYNEDTDSVEILFPAYKMRDIPLTTGVIHRLCERFERIKPGLGNPLFTETDGGEGSNTGLSMRRVREYAKEVFSKLGISSLDIDVFDESGEPVATDLHKFQGDIYKSTFHHRIVDQAMIEDDNGAYLRGGMRITTAGRSYLEYDFALPQHSMQVGLERWYAKSLPLRNHVSPQIIPIDTMANRPVAGIAGPTRQKMRIRIKVESVDEAVLSKDTFGINVYARYGFDLEAFDEGA